MNRSQRIGVTLSTLISVAGTAGWVTLYGEGNSSHPPSQQIKPQGEQVVISGKVVGEGYRVGHYSLVVEGIGDSRGRNYFESKGLKWDDSLDRIINLGDEVTIVVQKADISKDNFDATPINLDNFTRIQRGVSFHKPSYYPISAFPTFRPFVSN